MTLASHSAVFAKFFLLAMLPAAIIGPEDPELASMRAYLDDIEKAHDRRLRNMIEQAADWIFGCTEDIHEALESAPEREKIAYVRCIQDYVENPEPEDIPLPVGIFDAFLMVIHETVVQGAAESFAAIWTKMRDDKLELLKAVKLSIDNLPLGLRTVTHIKTAPFIMACLAEPTKLYRTKSKQAADKAFLECAKKESGKTLLASIPEKFYEEFVEEVSYLSNENNGANVWKQLALHPKILSVAFLNAWNNMPGAKHRAIDAEDNVCLSESSEGALHVEISERLKTPSRINLLNKKKKTKKFSDLFPAGYERVDNEALGDGTNKFGVAYAVRKIDTTDPTKPTLVGPELVMKITRKGVDPNEFRHHKALAKHKFEGVDDQDKFVPFIEVEKKETEDGTLEYYVMEYLGPTFANLLEAKKKKFEKVKLSHDEILLGLARMFLIQGALHSANFAHRDLHWNNWAFSRASPYVLKVFDFGQTLELSALNFHEVVKDIWRFREEAKFDLLVGEGDDAKFEFPADENGFEPIDKIVKKHIWFDYERKKPLALDTFQPKSYAEYEGTDLIKKLRKYVNKWLKTDVHNFSDKTHKLTRWWVPPSAGGTTKSAGTTADRKRRSPVSQEKSHRRRMKAFTKTLGQRGGAQNSNDAASEDHVTWLKELRKETSRRSTTEANPMSRDSRWGFRKFWRMAHQKLPPIDPYDDEEPDWIPLPACA